jgi:hypothetical protein
MDKPSKTFYLWDLADTLFGERWNVEKTRLVNFDAYIESLGYDLKTIDSKTYEWSYERPFKDGLMELSILPGFKETLSWTKHNATFTTGNPEQIEWRAEVFIKKGLPDIRPYFEKIYSTFDYGNINQKTSAMILDILKKEFKNGYTIFVYSDNNLENLYQFQNAADQIPTVKNRLYHIKARSEKFKKITDNFFETPDLFKLLENEQAHTSTKR